MLSYGAAYYQLSDELKRIYDQQEAAAIAHEAMLHITGLTRLQRLSLKDQLFSEEQEDQFENMKVRLMTGEPLQYVRGYEWFRGRTFRVDKNVLIPRPETEELVQWIIEENAAKGALSVVDIGTGSGCIPISLKLELPEAIMTAIDISRGSLDNAAMNATLLGADIQLLQLDFLDPASWNKLGIYDVIASNPPYIPEQEKEQVHANVKDFEPAAALFVPDNDPLIFYRQLASFGENHLKAGGGIYCEVHRDYAGATKSLFEVYGYVTELRKDLSGNERMLKAIK